jgi:peptidoglycan biosynthesis protein MviN/MurJ (putative lipid II flippase)
MSSLKKTALIITIISLICKLFGFGREIAVAYFFGTSFIVDAYLMAISIPGILFGWLTSLSVSFTPIYTDIRTKNGIEKSKQFTNNIISLVFIVAMVGVFIALIFNRQIVSITASGFKGEVFDLTSNYLNASIWTILFLAPIQILTSYLNCNNGFIFSIFSMAITTMIYPMLAQATAEENMTKLKDIFSKGSNIMIILFVPITIGAVILAKPAISFAFERGEFGASSSMMTTSAFSMYSISLLAASLIDVIIKVFYSMKDTKSILFVSAFAVILNIIFNSILIKPMGHAGLALGTSLSAILTMPIYFAVLRKKLGALGLKNTFILFAKSCISTFVMGVVVYFGFNYLSLSFGAGKLATLLSIALSAGVGGLIYFILMIAFKVKEMDGSYILLFASTCK